MDSILKVENLVQKFEISKKFLDRYTFDGFKIKKIEKAVHAVNNISFEVKKGEVFGLVGESGCGKSTTARTIINLYNANQGRVVFNGDEIQSLSRSEILPYRKKMQMIFQDPYASLNPRLKVKDIIAEPLLFHGICDSKSNAYEKVNEILLKVGLRPEQAERYPHQFSGGQRQRIGIARAIAVEPEFIIADEPVSALDVSIQAQIINLLNELKKEMDLSFLFIAHDLSVVKHISDRIAVMYLGQIVEVADKDELFSNPQHPYTKLLLSSVPTVDRKRLYPKQESMGEMPSPINLPKGCYFANRCSYAKELCKTDMPPNKQISHGHYSMCHFVGESNG